VKPDDVVEPAYASGGYVLPQFGTSVEPLIDITAGRRRVAQALGLLVPLGIALAAAFIVLPESAGRSRTGAKQTVTSSPVLAPDSVPVQLAAMAAARDTESQADSPRDANRLDPSGVVAGSSTSAENAASRRPPRQAPAAPSVRSAATNGVTTVASGGETARLPGDRAGAVRPPDDPPESPASGSRRDSTTAALPRADVVNDPFKIPSSPTPASLGSGGASMQRCALASTADQRVCLQAYVAAGDVPLNTAFASLVGELRRIAHTPADAPDPPNVQRIRYEQRAWMSVRESECPRSAPAGAGPFWAQTQAQCFNEMAKSRAAELRDAVKRLRKR
jgi:uncharacterized protein YecT (DUF1311 family)